MTCDQRDQPSTRRSIRPMPSTWTAWLVVSLFLLPGCMHRIDVHPRPSQPALAHIPRPVQITPSNLTIEGADHMPGITWLEWRPRHLTQSLLEYVKQRGTFSAVSQDPAPLSLTITTKLALLSRQGRYRYVIYLHAEMAAGGALLKSYDVEAGADGSRVRWVTDSDRDPIESALQAALDALLTSIESDRTLFLGSEPSRAGLP